MTFRKGLLAVSAEFTRYTFLMRVRLQSLLAVSFVTLPGMGSLSCAVGGEVPEEALLQAALNGPDGTVNPPITAQPSATLPNVPSVAPTTTVAPPANSPSATTPPPQPTPSPMPTPTPQPVPSGNGGTPSTGGSGGVPVVPEPEPAVSVEPDVPVDPTTPEPDAMTEPEPDSEPEPETMTVPEPEPEPDDSMTAPEPETMSMPEPEPEAVPGEPPPDFPTCPGKANDCQNQINACLADEGCANLAACANSNGCGQPKFCSACSAEIAAAGGENSPSVQAAESMYSCGCNGD